MPPKKQPTIFVQIASYRDPECQHTIKDMYDKAKYPERVYVGLCHQYDKSGDTHLFEVPYPIPENIREDKVHFLDAKGVCWARHRTNLLYDGEDYVLQIDSHMRFAQGWDVKMIEELKLCPADKPLLSGCIAKYTPPNTLDDPAKPTILRIGAFSAEGNIRSQGVTLPRIADAPLNGAFISAGYMFAKSALIEEVPYDPYLYFEQEEIMYAARLYTLGWDVFSDRVPYVYHHYISQKETPRPFQWKDLQEAGMREEYLYQYYRGVKRMRHMTGNTPSDDPDVTQELDKYGFGNVRSLREFENYCGLDLSGCRTSEYAMRAGFVRELKKYLSAVYVPELDDDDKKVETGWMTEEERLERLKAPAASPIRKQKIAQEITSHNDTIFVAMPNYADTECIPTLENLFAEAEHPERIFVGICWQDTTKPDGSMIKSLGEYAGQVRIKYFPLESAKGANWARTKALSMHHQETHILMCDAHSRFAKHWDTQLLKSLEDTSEERAVISTFLPNYDPPDKRQDVSGKVCHIWPRVFAAPDDPAFIHFEGALRDKQTVGDMPYPTPYITAHFVFAKSHVFNEVPIDPYIYFLGDEITYAARLWTHGYYIYHPATILAWHRFKTNAENVSKPYKSLKAERRKRTRDRVYHLLGLEFSENEDALSEIEYYGHGAARTLESFWEFAGINPEKRTVTKEGKKGQWVASDIPKPDAIMSQRIFVQIASYRDAECQYTVKDLFEKATHPERISIGICWQTDPEKDQGCFIEPYPYPDQVRVVEYHAKNSKGSLWARAEAQKLWAGEEYTLQIDAHMRFEKGWDNTLLTMLQQTGSVKPLLTTYAAPYEPPDKLRTDTVYRMGMREFKQDKPGVPPKLLYKSTTIRKEDRPDTPFLTATVCNAFMFAPSALWHEVPIDPYIYFYGDDTSFAARAWTHGWDIFSPHQCVIYHLWDRKTRPGHWGDFPAISSGLSKNTDDRVAHLVGMQRCNDAEILKELDAYGLGTVRSLEEYQRFAGINFATLEIVEDAKLGIFPVRDNKIMQRKQQFAEYSIDSTISKDRHILWQSEHAIVMDNFLSEEDYQALYDYSTQIDYKHINTQGKVARVWDLHNGFPLRNMESAFYYNNPEDVPEKSKYAYPVNNPFDVFMRAVNAINPEVSSLIGNTQTGYDHFSVTSWIYPPGTGLSMHDDGSGVYSGAYVYFLNPEWRPHWGGLLVVMDQESNTALQEQKKTGGSNFYKRKWLHLSGHDQIALEHGLGRCIIPKKNRMVFIHPDTYHMVTQVQPACGDTPRMTLAGFFHKKKNDKK